MNTSEILNSDIYSKYKEICSIIENDEEINTDDIRYYLSMYQEQRKVCKATEFSDI